MLILGTVTSSSKSKRNVVIRLIGRLGGVRRPKSIMSSYNPIPQQQSRRFYASEMRKSAFVYELLLSDLDDELQTSLYDFLETRGINDELAVYLHKHKSKNEYIRWMGSIESFIARKN